MTLIAAPLPRSPGYSIFDSETRQLRVAYVPFGWIEKHRNGRASEAVDPAVLVDILATPEPAPAGT